MPAGLGYWQVHVPASLGYWQIHVSWIHTSHSRMFYQCLSALDIGRSMSAESMLLFPDCSISACLPRILADPCQLSPYFPFQNILSVPVCLGYWQIHVSNLLTLSRNFCASWLAIICWQLKMYNTWGLRINLIICEFYPAEYTYISKVIDSIIGVHQNLVTNTFVAQSYFWFQICADLIWRQGRAYSESSCVVG